MSDLQVQEQTGAHVGAALIEFRGNLLRTPMLRGLRATQAIWPFKKEHSYVNTDFNFRPDRRGSSGVSHVLHPRSRGLHGNCRGRTCFGLGVETLVLSSVNS